MALINPQRRSAPAVPIDTYLGTLTSAHEGLVNAARRYAQRLIDSDPPVATWGQTAKRIVCDIDPHPLIGVAAHPFNEIVNQTAGIARLLEAIRFARDSLGAGWVLACHPTTTDAGEHDLWTDAEPTRPLSGGRGGAVFEISDVTSATGDSNRKAEYDIPKLCATGGDVVRWLITSPEHSRFLGATTSAKVRLATAATPIVLDAGSVARRIDPDPTD